MRTVVTGANRGIGLEFVRQLLARGDQVEAAVRDPEAAAELNLLKQKSSSLRVHRCDVGSDESVAAFAESVGPGPIDVLINNAGLGEWKATLQSVQVEDMAHTFNVNALGPFRMTRTLLSQLRAGTGRKVVHVTSGMGSISQNTGGGAYGYRMSKAALNMMSRSFAADLRRDRIVSVVVSPGWVQTDMGGRGAPTTPEESIRGMLKIIDGLTPAQSGTFLNFSGGEMPW